MYSWGFSPFVLAFISLLLLSKEDGVGIGRSWNVTRGSFWRIFAIFFTMTVITYAVIIVATLLLGLLPGSLIKAVPLVLINVIISPLILVVYAVTFYDLKLRTEASDLESMLQNTSFNSAPLAQMESIEGHV